MKLALISDVFLRANDQPRLHEALAQAAGGGADLALLPELPLNGWAPATKKPQEEDAEEWGGPRQEILRQAAQDHQITIVGGAIIRTDEGRRFNTALVFTPAGSLTGSYAKVHLPEEPGFWETSHYQPGVEAPAVFGQLSVPFGIQICSDTNRPLGSHFLASQGAGLILIPRATETATYERWKLVFRANALTCGCFVASVNRLAPERGVLLGGPSILVGPRGDVQLETTDPVAIVELDPDQISRARVAYPGYLAWPTDYYARCWKELQQRNPKPEIRSPR